ncbi:acylneuraminate cytidylyltransferase family protein [Aquiluna sp.]|nr:acylneuraminate cytidylyltransferase family protein [Aquiluna sp.]
MEDSSTLCVVPARGGSKGLTGKNKRLFFGKPLVWWTLRFCEELELGNFVLSSDDEEILALGREFSGCLSVRRPKHLATDTAGDQGVILHSVDAAEYEYGREFDRVLFLQPTAPGREIEVVKSALRIHGSLPKPINSSMWSVQMSPLKFHPQKQISSLGGRYFVNRDGDTPPRRQDLHPTYIRTGDFYILGREAISDPFLVGSELHIFELQNETINIDTLEDFERAERLLDISGNLLTRKDIVS